ncbi:transposase [Phormidium tenue]|uniref:Transposase zinc-ribbon domain-containing protein n=1 Tax=Phormidium tenue NIES-30 TaxID=549789 RepID=A0A1U7IY73_9CYAN|nr:transposase [Phormidium tenue FACHB-1052]OKH43440.1 hypothetical protein NIES30_24835 [Phormidium tenue NIES-30]
MLFTHEACLAYLEHIRWNGIPTCPYCQAQRSTPIRHENRYHCNYCYTSFSVTVNTVFHGSHIKLDKWFKAVFLVMTIDKNISIRRLAREISVTNTSASKIKNHINQAIEEDLDLLQKLAIFYLENNRSPNQ